MLVLYLGLIVAGGFATSSWCLQNDENMDCKNELWLELAMLRFCGEVAIIDSSIAKEPV
jgi:hypothetical protein